MSAHESIFAASYVMFYQQGYPPMECARRALQFADQALAMKQMVRPSFEHPAVAQPAPQPAPQPSQALMAPSIASLAAAHPTSRFDVPPAVPASVEPAMAEAIASSLPAGAAGPIVDTVAVEIPPGADTLDGYIARTPHARSIIQDLRNKFGFSFQDR